MHRFRRSAKFCVLLTFAVRVSKGLKGLEPSAWSSTTRFSGQGGLNADSPAELGDAYARSRKLAAVKAASLSNTIDRRATFLCA